MTPVSSPKKSAASDWKPLMDAAYQGNDAMVCKLLQAGADPNILSTTNYRHRPLHRVVEHKRTAPKTVGHEKVVKLLLEHGADPMLRAGVEMTTALSLAAMDEPRFLPLILPYTKKPDLFHACAMADVTSVKAILKKSPPAATLLDENGWSPLHYCASSAMYQLGQKNAEALAQITQLLLDHDADLNATYLYGGKHPIPVLWGCCGKHDNPAVAKVLFEAGANPCDGESVYHATEMGHQAVLALIEQYTDPAELAQECTRCLPIQLQWGVTRGMAWLLAHGANPNIPSSREDSGDTALHKAARNGASEKVITQLLANGADAGIKNKAGLTAMEAAQKAGKARVVAQLKAVG